jgi:hypothetical protein
MTANYSVLGLFGSVRSCAATPAVNVAATMK